MNRPILITGGVIAAHVVGLWAMHTGLGRRSEPRVIPMEVTIEMIELPLAQLSQPTAPAPAPTPPPPAAQPRPTPVSKPVVKAAPKPKPLAQPLLTPLPSPPPVPGPLATPLPEPTLVQSASTSESQPASEARDAASVVATQPTAVPAPATAPATKATPSAPPKIELPSSNASYLNNPKPPYPALSKRLNEQGKVLIRAHIQIDGSVSKASIQTSSGYDRLDQSALRSVEKWRLVPGKRGGQPEAMWFNIPITFEIE